MSEDRLDRLERLFKAARLHAPEERAAFLEAACADDPALRAELHALLQSDHQADASAFLQDPAPNWAADHLFEASGDADEEMRGRTGGPYVVQQRLGRGGMGDVYLAIREQPFKQYVALKIIRRGMNTRDVAARFAVERQILAALNHPNIARLFGGGMTEDGLPYLAMEYVDGRPITAYCDEERCSLPERLRLFQTVCHAVQYAHQNLVIHRDLKPTNILVTKGGTVKLLDFGIAKLLNPHLNPVDVPVTRTAWRLMTPEYASPEQVRGEALTTAAAVYALGVILYELLTGHRPYEVAGCSPQEILEIVCEQEPGRPSTKVLKATVCSSPNRTSRTVTPGAISTARSVPVERLRRQLRGDLDNIALMALRKEPGRRYGSAEQLGDDLERYLNGLPVVARPSTLRYRLRKFVVRHRVSVGASQHDDLTIFVIRYTAPETPH
jgi:serine/threonine protein kinase